MQSWIKKYISKVRTNDYYSKSFSSRDKRGEYSSFSDNKRFLSELKGKNSKELELELLIGLSITAVSDFSLMISIFL